MKISKSKITLLITYNIKLYLQFCRQKLPHCSEYNSTQEPFITTVRTRTKLRMNVSLKLRLFYCQLFLGLLIMVNM